MGPEGRGDSRIISVSEGEELKLIFINWLPE